LPFIRKISKISVLLNAKSVSVLTYSMKDLPKVYEAKNYEDAIYAKWLASDFFNPDTCVKKGAAKKDAPVFSMVLPPPNVTGILHMGHAVMLAIQDALVRYHRMKGDRTLWLPGADHAAIATQTKVEKLLMEKGMKDPKKELGREKFLVEVDKFAKASRDTIVKQCQKIGSSLDWSREVFTLDKKPNLAVRTVFKMMYDDGLIYRGYRIVNWCPRCQSTLADDEVEYREQSAKIYTFRYSKDFPIAISTTRPETKLGDTAVAVNPKDKRYKKFIGKTFEVKNFGGSPRSPRCSSGEAGRSEAEAGADLKIKIIGDEAVNMEFGTGAVGVTPAHSFVDYEMARKNKLPVIKIIDENSKMTAEAGPAYVGLAAKEARKKVVEYLRANNLLEKEEDAPNNLSVCYRCETPIEPLPSEQWFIDVNKKIKFLHASLKGVKKGQSVCLKDLMIKVVKDGKIKIVPERFEKTYFHWVNDLRDWCISRQIWYGHRIPVYRCKCDCHAELVSAFKKIPEQEEILKQVQDDMVRADIGCEKSFVSIEPITKCPHCGGPIEQDPDTLDTWFSSSLWTFSTLGWPAFAETATAGKPGPENDFANYHPTTVMETGYDILFFWVARMILMSTYVLGEIPFETVYLHGMVRDEKGEKMSKSKGNAIDPLDMVAKYGADATRLSLLIGNTPGNDLKLSEEKIAGFRNFTNKLWNICRFMLLNIEKPKISAERPNVKEGADKWILAEIDRATGEVTKNIEKFNFSYAGEYLRDFTWGGLADIYLEGTKENNKSEVLNYILNTILKLWHPFMPFVTEAIWREVYGDEKMLLINEWPESVGVKTDEDFEIIKEVVNNVRNSRVVYKVEPGKRIFLEIVHKDSVRRGLIEKYAVIIKKLCRLEDLKISPDRTVEESVAFVFGGVRGFDILIPHSSLVDVGKEKSRLQSEIAAVEPYLVGLEKKLANQEFVKNAPVAVVEKEKQKLSEAQEKLKKLKEQYENLH